jgi:hypothetical protein
MDVARNRLKTREGTPVEEVKDVGVATLNEGRPADKYAPGLFPDVVLQNAP